MFYSQRQKTILKSMGENYSKMQNQECMVKYDRELFLL